ncbi:hypothetical protein A1O3_05088 [Capronia epimyces CBS 606.96]|uniref:Pentatricopeptide repeat domain-containing protein n=1 Tax=Capronia epimyces CBS 606.96 TaxID=1182542 RepID=W9Y5E2_9EURO|nr:uncharacterized protein A1O3_05088 [Capronia epimyces CBS 606.96]EXJ84421.1 hypothetical protein A1O3_05088 [Capronia epimyces CBS 606.96]
MEQLLQENNPDRILLGLVTSSIGDVFVATADDETFTRAICALDPEYFIAPYRNLHRYVKPTLESEPRFRIVKSLEERITTFIGILDTLVTLRQDSGYDIPLDIYRHLLRCAAAGGQGNMARNVFRNLLPERNMIPDLECYNYFMEALNWNEAYGRFERYQLRVTPYSLDRRSSTYRRTGYTGHGVATSSNPDNEQSIRLEVLRVFNELVRQGLRGNEATFCNLMVAMGREGDIVSVKSVLKSVWNVDLDALDKYDEEELESPTFYEEGSPLRPTERLLFTVVHIFATNNEISVAGMLLDYLSRNYNLTIPEDLWTYLLEWTFVLSCQQQGWRVRKGFGVGRVSFQAVESLYDVFHSEPYNIKPKIIDLIFRAKMWTRRHTLDRALDDIRACMQMLDEERTNLSVLYDEMREKLRTKYDGIFEDGVASVEFLKLKREFLFASLRLDCHLQLIIIAVRNAFKQKDWPGSRREVEWAYRRLPQLVEEWSDYLPDIIPYYTPSGHVSLFGQEHRQSAIVSANTAQTTKTGAMRAMFDTYSPARLRHSADYVRRGPRGLAAFDEEAESDEDEAADWVLNYERHGRDERLGKRRYGHLNYPSADWRTEEWKPWSKHAGPYR